MQVRLLSKTKARMSLRHDVQSAFPPYFAFVPVLTEWFIAGIARDASALRTAVARSGTGAALSRKAFQP